MISKIDRGYRQKNTMNIKLLEFIGRKLRPVELRLLIKWVLSLKREKVVLPGNQVFEVDPISDFGLRLIKDNSYELEMTNFIESLLDKDDTFIDLGANEGFFTVLAGLLVSKKGKVFSIEPQKKLWSVIQNNISLNELCNVQLLPFGIGSKKQERNLQLYPSTNSGATSFSNSYNFKITFDKIRKRIYGTQLVKLITLDDLHEIFPKKVKLIKIDIEGFELEALKGATNLLRNKRFVFILIEIHHQALLGLNQSEQMIDDLLIGFDYSKNKIAENLNLYTAK